MKKLVVLSGVPGSGKSYFSKCVKEIKGTHVYVVSSDSLRKEMLGNQRNLSKEEVVWDIFYNLPKVYALDPEAFVILDATHTTSALRLKIQKDLAPHFDEIYLVLFHIPVDVARKQNKERENPVPDYVMDSFFESFEMPNEEENKVFNKVYVISNIEIDRVVNDIIG